MLHHDPVLLSEVELVLQSCESKKLIIDATLGLGGHAGMMLSHLGVGDTLLGFDRDSDNLSLARAHLAKIQTKAHFEGVHASFADLESVLSEKNFSGENFARFGASQKQEVRGRKFFVKGAYGSVSDGTTNFSDEEMGSFSETPEIDFILYDLGVSSAHYDEGSRGFSLRSDGPLDMRFDRTTGKTAEDLVHSLSERELMHIFIRYADEKKALFIAQAIVKARETMRIDTTDKLQTIVKASSFDQKSSLRVFQALRIAVNEEFEHIETSLRSAIEHLKIGGKIAVITFHSIEDRIVKNLFAEHLTGTIDDITGQTVIPPRLRKYTKKPIEPTQEEIEQNPRSRSAKMRVVERVN